jgi:organic radical activating enzyme
VTNYPLKDPPRPIDARTSYTAADSIPLKTVLDRDLHAAINGRRQIIPIHIQLIPTNRCNLNCAFCSCSERDRSLELDLGLARKVVEKCAGLGTKACTVTGGGEPLLHPKFPEIIDYLTDQGIKVGLVTNGLLLHKAPPRTVAKLTWCRISNGDDRCFTDEYRRRLERVVMTSPEVDWAFSHVVSSAPNEAEIIRVVEFANFHQFTHVRLVADLFHPVDVDMAGLQAALRAVRLDDRRVIYQGRKNAERGGPCYIGFLKPLIGADGEVYACCGVQYALDKPSRDLPAELRLGHALDMDKICERSAEPLDGSQCVRCYYGSYNILLRAMLGRTAHPEFL